MFAVFLSPSPFSLLFSLRRVNKFDLKVRKKPIRDIHCRNVLLFPSPLSFFLPFLQMEGISNKIGVGLVYLFLLLLVFCFFLLFLFPLPRCPSSWTVDIKDPSQTLLSPPLPSRLPASWRSVRLARGLGLLSFFSSFFFFPNASSGLMGWEDGRLGNPRVPPFFFFFFCVAVFPRAASSSTHRSWVSLLFFFFLLAGTKLSSWKLS